VLGVVLYERNELEAAAESARLAVQWSDLGGNPEARVVGYLCLAKTRLALGDVTGARAMMEKSGEAARHPAVSPFFQAWHAASRALFALWHDDLQEALRWGDRVSQYAHALPFAFHHVPARLMIARGEKAAAAEQLQGMYKKAVEGDAQGLVVAICVYQAMAAATPTEAMLFLSDALTRGQAEGFIRTFVDEGKLLAHLLRKAVSQGITSDYARKLLGIIEAEERESAARAAYLSHRKTPSVLSEREMDILRLLEVGLSNQQISQRLVITLATVKTHVHNICRKLNASTRTKAIFRARELKLI
jgi:LuxR family maltose regulon positive regulatory protein